MGRSRRHSPNHRRNHRHHPRRPCQVWPRRSQRPDPRLFQDEANDPTRDLSKTKPTTRPTTFPRRSQRPDPRPSQDEANEPTHDLPKTKPTTRPTTFPRRSQRPDPRPSPDEANDPTHDLPQTKPTTRPTTFPRRSQRPDPRPSQRAEGCRSVRSSGGWQGSTVLRNPGATVAVRSRSQPLPDRSWFRTTLDSCHPPGRCPLYSLTLGRNYQCVSEID